MRPQGEFIPTVPCNIGCHLKRNQGHHCRQVPEACLTERKVDEGMECHEAAANVNSITVGRPQAGDVGAIAVMKPVEVLVQRLHIMEKGVYKVKPCIVCHHCDPHEYKDVRDVKADLHLVAKAMEPAPIACKKPVQGDVWCANCPHVAGRVRLELRAFSLGEARDSATPLKHMA